MSQKDDLPMSMDERHSAPRDRRRRRLGDRITTLCQRLEQIYWQEWSAMMAFCPEPARPLFQVSGQRLRERLLDEAIGIVDEAENLMRHSQPAAERT